MSKNHNPETRSLLEPLWIPHSYVCFKRVFFAGELENQALSKEGSSPPEDEKAVYLGFMFRVAC